MNEKCPTKDILPNEIYGIILSHFVCFLNYFNNFDYIFHFYTQKYGTDSKN